MKRNAREIITFRHPVIVKLCLFVSCAILPRSAPAQFLQTDLNTYQLPDPKQEVVIVTTPRGIFVAHSPKRSGSISGFDLEQLTLSNSTSVFLAYIPNTRVPEKLVLAGSGNDYRIRGAFSIQLSDEVRLAAAMNVGAVPYITVVSTHPGEEGIIGFLGDQVVVNLGGRDAVEMLEADVLRRHHNNVILPYAVKNDNRLYLGDEPVQPRAGVGLLSPQDNDCLLDEARSIANDDYQRLLPLKPDDQRATLKKLLIDPKKTLSSSQLVILNVSSSRITAINVESGKLVVIKERELGEAKVCTVEPIQLKKIDSAHREAGRPD